MPKAVVEFSVKMVVGINSYALMQLSENYKEVHGFTPEGECQCVKNDIEHLGFQDWVENNLNDVPTEPDFYVFSGTAVFDEDSADYHATCVRIRHPDIDKE